MARSLRQASQARSYAASTRITLTPEGAAALAAALDAAAPPAPPARKADTGKAPWHLLPYDAIGAVVAVLGFGARKYAERNWERGLSHSRTFAATQRHLTDWFQLGLDRDPETGLHPLAHAACEVLFALAFALRETAGVDDRPKVGR